MSHNAYPGLPNDTSGRIQYRSRAVGAISTRTSENIRSVTIKQLQDASNSPTSGGRYVLNSSQLYTVVLCGILQAVEQHENYTDFIVYDGTGSLEGRLWPKDVTGSTDLSGSTIGAYYTFIGRLIKKSQDIMLAAMKATQVNDHNSITLHMLSVIQEHCQLNQLTNTDLMRWDNARNASESTIKTALAIEMEKEAIFNLLSAPHIRLLEEGVTAQFIMKEMLLGIQEARHLLRLMIEDGSIYNTIDYNHYKLAD